MSKRSKDLHLIRNDPLALEIQRVLEEDLAHGAKLMLPEYRASALKTKSLDGYCAVAAAAYFFRAGGRAKGLQPMQRTEHKRLSKKRLSHWWIVQDGNAIIDLTLRRQDPEPDYPYENGTPRGFMQTGYLRPSKRAAELMARVEQARGSR